MNTLTLNSYAKLNLYLAVLNKRKDNYHNINTIFERIDLCDKIILAPRQDKKINIICTHPHIPKDNLRNLAFRSAKLLQESFKIDRGVDIKIIKRIPLASGLGGGSSNAAAVLVGLNKFWKLNIAQNKLITLAKKIGSDVPFFIYNSPFAEGKGRGDMIKPLKPLNSIKFWHILIVSRKKKVSTMQIYKKWDRLRAKLTSPRYDVKILYLALRKRDFSLMGKAMFNSLEQVTTQLFPEIRHIKARLMSLGIKSILMSGSGPAVFGIVSSRKEATSLCMRLKKRLVKEGRSWQVFITQTH